MFPGSVGHDKKRPHLSQCDGPLKDLCPALGSMVKSGAGGVALPSQPKSDNDWLAWRLTGDRGSGLDTGLQWASGTEEV